MLLPLLFALTLQATPKDSAHVIGQMRRLDSVRVAMDSLRRWCRVASYQTPKYLRRVCPMALASPDAHARWYEDSLILKPVPPVPPDTTTPPIPPDTTTPPPIPPDTAHFAGPAELPRIYLSFPYPAPTRTVQVAAGANLQTALNAAQRGDELVLAAGATYTGNFTFTACAPGWITVRSSGVTNVTGTRVTPSTAATFAKIVTPNTDAAIKITGCRLRLAGVEVTIGATVNDIYGIVTLEGASADIVLDRVYIHGLTGNRVVRCVGLHSRSSQISDSWISDCHSKGQDSQAIWGGQGAGPYKIVNNHLEGAGENVMFGGADPTTQGLVPSDIEIRRNYFLTPVSWKGVWTKKNLFELKNAVRVLVEGNVFDGSWTDGQTGWGIVLKSANQNDGGGCRWCRTTDVTMRHNQVRNVGAGMNIIGNDGGSPTDSTTMRVMVTENVVEVGAQPGDRRGFQLLGGAHNITLTRNVLAGTMTANLFVEGAGPGCAFTDNVWAFGQYGVFTSGGGTGTTVLNTGCKTGGWTWTGMTLVGAQQNGYPPTTWVSSESQAPLAAQIRAIVQQATAGVVVPP